MVMIVWLVIGAVAALALSSFLSGRGGGGSSVVNLIAGAAGGFVGGYAFLLIGPSVVGPGPEFFISMLGAGVGSVVAVLVAMKIFK